MFPELVVGVLLVMLAVSLWFALREDIHDRARHGAPVEIGTIITFGPPALHLEARRERSIVRGVCVRQVLELDAMTLQRAPSGAVGELINRLSGQAAAGGLRQTPYYDEPFSRALRWEWTR